MASMLTVEEAQTRILESVQPLQAVARPLLEAQGWALAEDVRAGAPLPPFANSAMDGYAVRSEDVQGASAEHPRRLRVLGDLPAGAATAFTVEPGTAVRIMTGAPLPAGADAVVMVEDTEPAPDGVQVLDSVAMGENVRPAGEDVSTGELVLTAGDSLGPAEMGMLAALGVPAPRVVQRPRVAVLTTGDEVIEPGQELAPGKIRNSNRYALAGLVRECADLTYIQHVPDEPAALRAALEQASKQDVVISAGGVSVGEYDYVKQALRELGELDFWRIAVKPGKPLAFGSLGGRPYFGLPGNPVSAMVTFELFVRPALRRMGGHREALPRTVEAVLDRPVAHRPGRQEYQRAWVEWDRGMHQYRARPLVGQGSGMLKSMVQSNGFVVIPLEAEDLPAGARVEVLFTRSRG